MHVIRSDVVPSTGEHCPYVGIFFRMADGSHLAFFDLGDDVAAAPSPNTPSWVNHIALRVDSLTPCAPPRPGSRRPASRSSASPTTTSSSRSTSSIPTGIRLELTVPTASAETTARHEQEVHAAVEAWTKEKRARLAQDDDGPAREAAATLSNYGAMDA